jgi:hypothetical protein
MLTTGDDHLTVKYKSSGNTSTIYFDDCSNYEKLQTIMTEKFTDTPVSIKMNPSLTFSLFCAEEFKILEVSHRAALLLGLYHCKFRKLKSVSDENGIYEMILPSAPLTCLGNILYLTSKHANAIGANDFNSDLKLSIAYKYGDILYPSIPCVSRREGYWIYCLSEDLADVEFQLVDFQFHPIIIKNPIHLSIQVEFGGDVF